MNSAQRIALIINNFTAEHSELTGAEIADITKLPKSTVYFVLASLAESGLIEKSENGRKYRIGPVLFEKGSLYIRNKDNIGIIEPIMKLLNDLTDEGISVGIPQNSSVIRILREESRKDVRFIAPVGVSMPAYASNMGKAILSTLTDEQIDKMYPHEEFAPRTRKTITKKSKLKFELEKIRRTGISFDDEGCWEGVSSVAGAVRDSSGKAVAGISLSLPTSRMNRKKREKYAALIKMAVDLISSRLGYVDTATPILNELAIRNWWLNNKPD